MMLFYLFLVVLGLLTGSFANAAIYRIPREISLGLFKNTRSFCPHCKHKIFAWDNIPLLSFFFLKGKCRQCKQKISARYPFVEIAWTVIFVFSVFWMLKAYQLSYPFTYQEWIKLLVEIYFVFSLFLTVFIDIDFRIIPDRFSLGNWLIALVFAFFHFSDVTFLNALIGGLSGSFSFFFIAWAFEKIRGVEGLGMGDVKMMGWLGSWLGFFNLPHLVMVGSLSGLIWGLWAMRSSKEGLKTAIPFGPFLALGAYILWIYNKF